MTEPNLTDYFESSFSNEPQRRRYAQNSLIVDTAVAINKAVEAAGITQRELAARLGRTEGFVSQVLSGGGNLTLRTLADFAYGLNCIVDVALQPVENAKEVAAPGPIHATPVDTIVFAEGQPYPGTLGDLLRVGLRPDATTETAAYLQPSGEQSKATANSELAKDTQMALAA